MALLTSPLDLLLALVLEAGYRLEEGLVPAVTYRRLVLFHGLGCLLGALGSLPDQQYLGGSERLGLFPLVDRCGRGLGFFRNVG